MSKPHNKKKKITRQRNACLLDRIYRSFVRSFVHHLRPFVGCSSALPNSMVCCRVVTPPPNAGALLEIILKKKKKKCPLSQHITHQMREEPSLLFFSAFFAFFFLSIAPLFPPPSRT